MDFLSEILYIIQQQANLDASQDVLVSSAAEDGFGAMEPSEASGNVFKEMTTSSVADVISQDIFSPGTSQEVEPLPSQDENPIRRQKKRLLYTYAS